MAIRGTEYDPRPENRPSAQSLQPQLPPTIPKPPAAVNSIQVLSLMDSEDEEDVVAEVEGNAARVEKVQEKGKWSNLTKILKRGADKDRNLAIPKVPRSGDWRPTLVKDEMDVEEDPVEEIHPVTVEINPDRKGKRTVIPRQKYMDKIL